MRAKDILSYLNRLYPLDTACDFDNVGLLVGDYNADVKRVLLSLDCTLTTVKTAVECNCNLIITHHPIIFEPLKNVLAGSVVFELIKNGITVISMHTNLDVGDGGVNDCLCKAIGLENIKKTVASDGFLLNEGAIKPQTAESLANHLKSTLKTNIRFADGGKEITKVLVCSGSGGNFITDAIIGGFDALITSEVKHHQFLLAADNGISIFDAGHFNTEDIVIEPLKEILSKQFGGIKFFTTHASPIKSI